MSVSFFSLQGEYVAATRSLFFYGILDGEEDDEACVVIDGVSCECTLALPPGAPPLPRNLRALGEHEFYPYGDGYQRTPMRGTRVAVDCWSHLSRYLKLVRAKVGAPARVFNAVDPSLVATNYLHAHSLTLGTWWSVVAERRDRVDGYLQLSRGTRLRAGDESRPPPTLRVGILDIETDMNDDDRVLSFNFQCAEVESFRTVRGPIANWQVGLKLEGGYQGSCPHGTFTKEPTERALLERLCRLLRETRCHVLTGYNIGAFDVPKVVKRLIKNGVEGVDTDCSKVASCLTLSRIPKRHGPTQFHVSKFHSKGKGVIMKFQAERSYGTIVWDLYQHVSQNDYGLPDKRLSTLAKRFLQSQTKDPIAYDQIRPYLGGTLEQQRAVHKYNKVDCDLVLLLVLKLDLLRFIFSEMTFFGFNPEVLACRGATVRSESQVRKKGLTCSPPVYLEKKVGEREEPPVLFAYADREDGARLLALKERRPDLQFGLRRKTGGEAVSVLVGSRLGLGLQKEFALVEYKNGEDYIGAVGGICYPPVPAHASSAVAVLDFASFYPNTMIAEGLCGQSVVSARELAPSGVPFEEEALSKAVGVPVKLYPNWYVKIKSSGLTVPPIRVDQRVRKLHEDDVHVYYEEEITGDTPAVVDIARAGRMPLMAEAAKDALDRRKQTRRLMKDYDPGSEEHARLNTLQLLHKITANSLYGQLLAKGGIAAPRVGALVTACCRRSIIRVMMEVCRPDWHVRLRHRVRPAACTEREWAALLAWFDRPRQARIRYGDTDSVMFLVEGLSPRLTAVFATVLEDSICNDVFEHERMSIELENVYVGMVTLTAKNYTALQFDAAGRLEFGKPRAARLLGEEEDEFYLFDARPEPLRVSWKYDGFEPGEVFANFEVCDENADLYVGTEPPPPRFAGIARWVDAEAVVASLYDRRAGVPAEELRAAVCEAVAAVRPDCLRCAPKVKVKNKKRSASGVSRKASLMLNGSAIFGRELPHAVRLIRDRVFDGFFQPSDFCERVKVGKTRAEYSAETMIAKLLDEKDDEGEFYGQTLEYIRTQAYDEWVEAGGTGQPPDCTVTLPVRDGVRPSVYYPLFTNLKTMVLNVCEATGADRDAALAELFRRPPSDAGQRAASVFSDVQSRFGVTAQRLEVVRARSSADPSLSTWFEEGRRALAGAGPWSGKSLRDAFGPPPATGKVVVSARNLHKGKRPATPHTFDRDERVKRLRQTCLSCVQLIAGPESDLEEMVRSCANKACKTHGDRACAQRMRDEELADCL